MVKRIRHNTVVIFLETELKQTVKKESMAREVLPDGRHNHKLVSPVRSTSLVLGEKQQMEFSFVLFHTQLNSCGIEKHLKTHFFVEVLPTKKFYYLKKNPLNKK